MPQDTQALEKAMVDGGDDTVHRKKFFREDIDWEKFEPTRTFSSALFKLRMNDEEKSKMCFPVAKIKTTMTENPGLAGNLFEVFKIPPKRESANQGPSLLASRAYDWTLTLFYDCLREDSSFFDLIDKDMRNGAVYAPLVSFVERSDQVGEEYTVGKAAWLLTSMIANLPQHFASEDVKKTLDAVVSTSPDHLTKHAKLEALSNMLKCNDIRQQVWTKPGVSAEIFSVRPEDPSQTVYRFVFNIWMLSFDKDITLKGSNSLKSSGVVKLLKDILAKSRTEKVVRLSLVVLENLLKHKELCKEIVEAEMLDVVQQLEYEKWRDAELYESIRKVASLVATEQSEFSNFDAYLSDLSKGKLSWGFLHTYKFWSENYKLFDDKTVTKLAGLLSPAANADDTTLAVACHDIGEFVSLHPSGKQVIAKLQVKENVMALMQKEGEAFRQVRREALLCCQKIMLNKWQDAAAKSA